MDLDSEEDNYDYLSALKSGRKDLSDESDVIYLDSDSEDCVLIDNKCPEVTDKSTEEEVITSKPKVTPKTVFGEDVQQLNQRFSKYFSPKRDSNPKSEPKVKSTEETVFESNVNKTNEMSIQTDFVDKNLFIDSHSELSSDTNTESEVSSCNSDEWLLTAIERIKDRHQKPTFDRIFTQYKKIKRLGGRRDGTQPGEGPDPKAILSAAIDDSVDRKVIERIVGLDFNDISYQPMSRRRSGRMSSSSHSSDISQKKKKKSFERQPIESNSHSDDVSTQPMKSSTTPVSSPTKQIPISKNVSIVRPIADTSLPQLTKISLKRQRSDSNSDSNHSSDKMMSQSEDESRDSDVVMSGHNNRLMATELESLSAEDYCDINDIDVSSSQLFADTDIDPKVFESLFDSSHSGLISKSLNSTPIKSFNHNRNSEVIKKSVFKSNTSSPNTGSTTDTASEIASTSSLRSRPKNIPIEYQNWLTEVLPRYSPFIGQKGDRVMYLRDAHLIYINYELPQLLEQYPKKRCEYELICNAIPSDDFIISAVISDIKFFQINYIKFSVISLKSTSKVNTFEFNVLYRPNRGVCEFLVLKKLYDNSITNEWAPGYPFRSLWKTSWWLGVIRRKSVFNNKYPKSLFKCFEVKWNTGEEGRLSPWDLFVIDEERLPKNVNNGIAVTPKDLIAVNYPPNESEWPEVENLDLIYWRCHECKRIYCGIKSVERRVNQSIVHIFKNCRHSEIAYSLTLKTIKERLKNMYYRRKDSVINDINCLKTNCKLYVNKSDLKLAEDFVDLILNIANNTEVCGEVAYEQVVNSYQHLVQSVSQFSYSLGSVRDHSYATRNETPGPSQSANHSQYKPRKCIPKSDVKRSQPIPQSIPPKKKRKQRSSSQTTAVPEVKTTESTQWITDSQKFIEDMFRNEKSLVYRQPVDPILFPTYSTVISDPIDLTEIKNKLLNNEYSNPNEIRQDFRLMFTNAKVFTKDPKSAMRLINKELSNQSEDRLREIIVDWERVYKYEKQKEKSGVKVREPTSRHELWGFTTEQYY